MKFDNSLYRPNPSGRLGSSVFGKNKAGLYEKMFARATNPRTVFQVLLRILFSAVTRAWANLTKAQRQSWNNLTPFFAKKSGFNIFVAFNRNLQDVGEAIVQQAPSIENLHYPDSFTTFTVEVDSTPGSEEIKLNIEPAIAVGTKVKVFATAPQKPSEKIDFKKLSQIGTIDSTFLTTHSIKDMYLAKFQVMPGTGSETAYGVEPVDIETGLAASRQETSSTGTL